MHAANLTVGWNKVALLPLLANYGLGDADANHPDPAAFIRGGDYRRTIPSWHIQSTESAGGNATEISKPGFDISGWHDIKTSRCTLMACLLHEGVYDDAELFFSENLKEVDRNQFLVSWLYRHEFCLGDEYDSEASENVHYFVETNGVTSKGDIFLNGKQIADGAVQKGAYAGRSYEITEFVERENALVIQVYPTDYNYDLALGFVDWNPYPPDNGTGVWRNVVVRRTGPVHVGPMHVTTDIELPVENATSAVVTLKAVVQNLEDEEVAARVEGEVYMEGAAGDDDYGSPATLTAQQSITLQPKEQKEIRLLVTVKNPEIWWPRQWGSQPLYTASLSCSIGDTKKSTRVSDASEKLSFGIRTVTSELNSFDDRVFSINGHPFQVIGGGYSADMFLRWDGKKFSTQVSYMMDMGLNTLRLEGKQEQPELYEIADKVGLMVMAGWECCDKWEAWRYNDELGVDPVPWWDETDYQVANVSLRHEADMMQSHPSMLAFLVGSDFWPDNRATDIYVEALKSASWDAPIVSSASQRGFPERLGNSGMKMDGPYDWVPPNYWYDEDEQLGAAFGFGSELGAGVGTPELGSLRKFLKEGEMDDMWQAPDEGLYHMSTDVSQFYDRGIYNEALRARYGTPESLEEYLLKAQMMDYEATRAEFEAYAARWTTADGGRPATGMVYWMLNNAWPSLHWNLFDYYMHPAGSFYGTKLGARMETVVYDYASKGVYLVNRSLGRTGKRTIYIQVVDEKGEEVANEMVEVEDAEGNASVLVKQDISDMLGTSSKNGTEAGGVVFLRLVLSDGGEEGEAISRNVYWLPRGDDGMDELDWENSDWFYTPVTKYANFTPLFEMEEADLNVSPGETHGRDMGRSVVLENKGSVPAVFVRLGLVDEEGEDVLPVRWGDNYVTLWPGETLEIQLGWEGDGYGSAVQVSGVNVKDGEVRL
ncbi:hypothetical protein MKZ38_006356 [Zalerion maritima]|uniref:Exo-1,4-beta-D-glucosaminidase n=1 Tax=Zalerion maritima TaxID=339359 RepID=A0AAD5RXJ0_9PEZI|nr:hypothetical protein MKZ38_006356 [Zalerion maritima]